MKTTKPLKYYTLNSALLAAVESGNPSTAYVLISHEASNIDEALVKSRKLKKYMITAALLIIKAAMENDRVLVMKLYGKNVQGETIVPLREEDNLIELQAAVASETIDTVMPIKISQKYNSLEVIEELLLQTDVDKDSGAVGWYGLYQTQLKISCLKKIQWVKKLRLDKNELKSLPPGMENYLKHCTSLNLQSNRLCEIPPSLLQLPSIIKLDLSHNVLSDFPNVSDWSASLTVLDLSYNQLSSLPNSVVAATLKNLNIGHNQFCTFPRCVCFFISLITLSIAHNPITKLPCELGKLKNLLNLDLDGLKNLSYPPKDVCVTTVGCIRYLNNQLRKPKGYYCMKMMALGKQAVGKSTLVARLCNKEVSNNSSNKLVISKWQYQLAEGKKTFYFNIWDLPGQKDCYPFYECFMTKHCLYLLVWKITDGDSGIADLKPWLNIISALGPGSFVIIVGTFFDMVTRDDQQSGKLDELSKKVEELTRQYRNLVVTHIMVGLKGCRDHVGRLKDYIYNAAYEYKINGHSIMGQKVPSSYHLLGSIYKTKQKPIMLMKEFKERIKSLKLVDIQGDDDELRKVTQFLHEVGILLHYDDRDLNELYFIDPGWLFNLISTVITTVREQNFCVKQGIVINKHIPFLFKDTGMCLYQCLALFDRFGIALPLDKDNKRILIPFVLPEKCVVKLQPDYKNCYSRLFLFHSPPDAKGLADTESSVRSSASHSNNIAEPLDYSIAPICSNQSLDEIVYDKTPPGLWGRLLSRVMTSIKKIQEMISKQFPTEEKDLIIHTSDFYVHESDRNRLTTIQPDPERLSEINFSFRASSEVLSYSDSIQRPLESSIASEASSIRPTNAEGSLESTPRFSTIDASMEKSETSSISLEIDEGTLKSTLKFNKLPDLSQEYPNKKSVEALSVDGGVGLVNWHTRHESDQNRLSTIQPDPERFSEKSFSSRASSEVSSYSNNIPRPLESSFASEASSIRPTIAEGSLESTLKCNELPYLSQEYPNEESIDAFLVDGHGESLVSWYTGHESDQNRLLTLQPDPERFSEKSFSSRASSEVSSYSNNIPVPLESSFASEASSIRHTIGEGSLELTLKCNELPYLSKEYPNEESIDAFFVDGGGSLVYWRTGLVYINNANKLNFRIESLADSPTYRNKHGILLVASQGAEGGKILSQLIDIVEKLISEWYPGLSDELERKVPCSQCLKSGSANPHEFNLDHLTRLITDHKLTHECKAKHEIQLIEIVPNLVLGDLDTTYLLNPKEISVQESEGVLATGVFGKVYHGKYNNRKIIVKLFIAEGNGEVENSFEELLLESKILLKFFHPCLTNLIGITITPVMSLILESAPVSFQNLLLTEPRSIPRIVLHRVAIQVAYVLQFLYSKNIVFHDFKATNVCLWSPSLDHFINCKVVDLNISSHIGSGGIPGLNDTKKNIASEVLRSYDIIEDDLYDSQKIILLFGKFLYQILYRIDNVEQLNTQTAIEGIQPKFKDDSVAEIGFYYMTHVMKLCLGSPEERPTTQQIIKWLSVSALQLIMSVVPLSTKYLLNEGCIITPPIVNIGDINQNSPSTELWICCDGVGGSEVKIFDTDTMEEICRHSFKENKIQCIKQCGQYMWISSRVDPGYSVVHIFNHKTKRLVHSVEIKENTVSCIVSSDHLVYLGTTEGKCFVFPINTLQASTGRRCVCVSEYDCIDGLALTQTSLWISIRDSIHFFNPQTLEFEGEKKRQNVDAYVGKMILSDARNMIWSAQLGGIILSAWNTHERANIIDVDVCAYAKEKCHIRDSQDWIITAMCTALDTVWIGLSSGYIMIFGMSPPGKLLTYFKPYNSPICFLSACKYPGPFQEEECMMLCGGEMYCPDDSFKELPDYSRKDKKGKAVNISGVIVLWEALPAKYTRQVQYLSKGTPWLNHDTLEKAMNDTGFTDSFEYL